MLRQTLSRWLERKSVRPVMTRAGRSAGRTAATTTTAVSAAPSASPGYRSGDADDLDGSEALDWMEDNEVPIEPLGRPLPPHPSTATGAKASARHNSAQEILARLEHKYHLAPGGGPNNTGEARRSGRSTAVSASSVHAAHTTTNSTPPARRVMSTPRRPHGAAAATENDGYGEHAHGSVGHAPAPRAGGAAVERGEEEDAYHVHNQRTSESGSSSSHNHPHDHRHQGASGDFDKAAEEDTPQHEAVVDDGAGGDEATTAKSADAYRFLLNHIDAEIAALQRRHSSVTTRRQNVQTRQTQRIKELFEIIEAPWTLLPTEAQPALPATGVDVYIKEQQLARQQRLGGAAGGSGTSSASGATSAHDGQDKMYVLALHKNYKSMPAGRKRFYEEAAHYNAAVREEMKFQLTRGCARFEAFLDRVKECTMEMAREGQVPELPSGHAHQRAYAARSAASHRHDSGTRTAASTPAAGAHRQSHRVPAQPIHNNDDADGEEVGESDAALSPDAPPTATAAAAAATPKETKGKKGKRASRRVKEAAKAKGKASAESSADAAAPGAAEKDKSDSAAAEGNAKTRSSKKGKAGGNRKPSTTEKTRLSSGAGGQKKKKPAKATKSAKAGVGATKSTQSNSKKAASTDTSTAASSSTGASRSIPLPNLNQLALKKIKQMAAPTGGKKKKAAAPKATKAKAAGGKKKKK